MQLLLISKFYCFRKGPHISFKHGRHLYNHLRCPMTREVSHLNILVHDMIIMKTEETSKNFFTYIKKHYGETILAKIQKLEKTMIKYSSYTNHLRFSLCCHHNKVLPKDLQLKSRIRTERSKIILQRAGKLLL